jgi:hypothetical protein
MNVAVSASSRKARRLQESSVNNTQRIDIA